MSEAEERVDFEIPETSNESLPRPSGWTREDVEAVINAIGRLLDKWVERDKFQIERNTEVELTKYRYWLWTTVGVTSLVGLILIGIYLLASHRVLSSEGVSFLLGTIVGYLFGVFGGLVSGMFGNKREG